ncbi:hypothetical protein V8E36_007507 [Tilletia maclaganii]
MMSSTAGSSRPLASDEAQLDLRTFLNSIHADLVAPASSTDNDDAHASSSAATALPSLPASARVSMLDAQIDIVNAKIKATLRQNAQALQDTGQETLKVHRSIRELGSAVEQLKEEQLSRQQQGKALDHGPMSAVVTAFVRANRQALLEAYSVATLRALHNAVASLELLEQATIAPNPAASHVRLETLAQNARTACAEIGIDLAQVPSQDSTKDLAWLGTTSPTSHISTVLPKLKWWQREESQLDLPAVRLLRPRLEGALRQSAFILASRERADSEYLDSGFRTAPTQGYRVDLPPGDEVRRKARALLVSPQGWAPVTTIDIASSTSASAASSLGGDNYQGLSPPTAQDSPKLGGRGMQLPSRNARPISTRPPVSSHSEQPPTCIISQRSVDLVRLAEHALDEARKRAKRLTREMAAGPAADDQTMEQREVRLRAIAALLRAIPDIFTLHTALMPTLHPQALWTDAAYALQFANDCSHLAAQCVRLGNVLLIASNARDELGRLVNARKGEQGEGVVRKAVENAAQALEEASQSTTGLGLRVLNRQMVSPADLDLTLR